MYGRRKIILLFLVVLIVLGGGFYGIHRYRHSFSYQCRHFQTLVSRQIECAQHLTDEVRQCISTQTLDSLVYITSQQKDVLIYIFDVQGLVYWSDNWLVNEYVHLYTFDKWNYTRFKNAHTISQWTHAGEYNILTVIPIQYHYSHENKNLHNTFIPPFNTINDDITIVPFQDSTVTPIYDLQHHFLFSLHRRVLLDEEPTQPLENIYNTFSYHNVLNTPTEEHTITTFFSQQKYYILSVLLLIIFVIIALVSIYRTHGMRDMTLVNKFLLLIFTVIVISYTTILLFSTQHIKRHYALQQVQNLQVKSKSIQSTLQNFYYWNILLSDQNTSGLNSDLRDLSYYYQTDIHVYDLRGELIGTSIPALFDNGILSRHISPLPYFHNQLNECQTEHLGSLDYLTTYTEFYNGNFMQIGYIALPSFVSKEAMHTEVNTFLSKLIPPYLIIFIIALIVTYFLSRRITAPMHTLGEQMARYQVGQSKHIIVYDGNDEVGQLVREYNTMVTQLERSTELLAQSAQESAWRTMARQIAHEINNSLTPMKLTIQQLQRVYGTERFTDYFTKASQTLVEQIDTLARIASSFSLFAKLPQLVLTDVDIAQKLSGVVELMKNNTYNIPIRYIGPTEGVLVHTDEQQVSQVFTNIILNALQALEDTRGGNIIIVLKSESTQVTISISDNGSGIPSDIQEKIFVPNFTTKSTGTGIGLAISKNIIEGSKGTITFSSSPQGTTFYITFENKAS